MITVLCIWGTIAYKIINGINSDTPKVTTEEFDLTFNPKKNKAQDTFSLQNIDRDPFLGTLNTRKKISKKTKINPKKLNDQTPFITYNGLVKKNDTQNQVFVININNKQYLLKKGQIVDSVKLIRGNSKDIMVRYKNKSQVIKRQ